MPNKMIAIDKGSRRNRPECIDSEGEQSVYGSPVAHDETEWNSNARGNQQADAHPPQRSAEIGVESMLHPFTRKSAQHRAEGRDQLGIDEAEAWPGLPKRQHEDDGQSTESAHEKPGNRRVAPTVPRHEPPFDRLKQPDQEALACAVALAAGPLSLKVQEPPLPMHQRFC
jgi:hypothetical protein